MYFNCSDPTLRLAIAVRVQRSMGRRRRRKRKRRKKRNIKSTSRARLAQRYVKSHDVRDFPMAINFVHESTRPMIKTHAPPTESHDN